MQRPTSHPLLVLLLVLCLLFPASVMAAEPHVVPGAQLRLDGKPDEDLSDKTLALELTMNRIGGGIGPYTVFLCYDNDNVYFACLAEDNVVSCKDDASADFKDSDYIRFYICVDDDFKGRQALNGDTDWAIIFTPQNTNGDWEPMVREDPYNGPGHGAIEGDDITPNRASGPTDNGWYVEAAIPWSLYETTVDKLSKLTFGTYFIAGDTDKSGVRTGEMSVESVGQGNYWNSPDFWQETILGEPYAVAPGGKLDSLWARLKAAR